MHPTPRWGLARVNGPSMEPTLRSGDRVLVDYRAAPRAGDVVVARLSAGADGGTVLAVKRAWRRVAHYREEPPWLLVPDNAKAPGVWSSVEHGPVPASDVLGVVRLRLWPRPRRIGRRTVWET